MIKSIFFYYYIPFSTYFNIQISIKHKFLRKKYHVFVEKRNKIIKLILQPNFDKVIIFILISQKQAEGKLLVSSNTDRGKLSVFI